MLQAAVVLLLSGGRRNWEVLAAAAVGLTVFTVVALLARLPLSGLLGCVQLQYHRFLSLFFRSMNPSFRLKHLGRRRPEAGEAEETDGLTLNRRRDSLGLPFRW
jgi:hypothetical protein